MKVLNYVLIILVLISVSLNIYQYYHKEESNDISLDILIPDTLISKNPYVKPDKLPNTLNPNKVTLYPKEMDTLNDISIISDTIKIKNISDSISILDTYLKNYPLASKLISMDLSKDNLTLDLLNIEGNFITKNYTLDLNSRTYRYVDNELTYKDINTKTTNFYFEGTYSIRPIDNLHDLDLSFNIETKRVIYKVGINTYLYPKFNSIGIGPKLSLTYKIPF